MSDKSHETPDKFQRPKRGWLAKFADAFRGIGQGTAGQSSFAAHLIAAIAVVTLAAYLSVSLERWCLLVLCIGVVMSAELFNSSLERIARSITDQVDPNIRMGLNIASAAVLTLTITAAIVGGVIFVDALFA